MKFQFAQIFISQCAPLIACVLVGVIGWVLVKFALQFKGCDSRRYARHQTLWSNWT